MKKIRILTPILLLNFSLVFSQATIKSDFDPLKTNRYLNWDSKDNVSQEYKVIIFKKIGKDNYKDVEEVVTSKNFHQIPSEFLGSDFYYRIQKKSDSPLLIIYDNDVLPIEVPVPGTELGYAFCANICHGPSYSWMLTNYTNTVVSNVDNDNDGYYDIHETGTSYLSLSEANGYYNKGVYVPFYTIMDQADLDWYIKAYKDATQRDLIRKTSLYPSNNTYDYFHVSNLPVNHGYRDLDGNVYPFQSGYLVRKSLFRFDWMDMNRTSNLNKNSLDNLCTISNPVSWATTFNNSSTYPGNQTYPSSNASNVISSLTCVSVPLPSEGNDGSGGDDTGGSSYQDWAQLFQDFYLNCISDWLSNLDPQHGYEIDCIGQTNPGGGVSGNGVGHSSSGNLFKANQIIFTRVDRVDEKEVVWIPKNENSEFYMPNNIVLENGLYLAQFILKGRVVPIYFENKKENNKIYKISEYVSATIISNPIVDNTLKLDVISSKKIKYTLRIYNLEGFNFHTENGILLEGKNKNLMVKINKKTNPYNQIRVVMEFEDGSKIEKTTVN